MGSVAQVKRSEPMQATAPKKVSIFGATGSVGCSTISLINEQPENFQIEVLTANRNVEKLAEQAISLKARKAVIATADLYEELKDCLSGTGIEAAAGTNALNEAASEPVDWIMSAIVGAAGLAPTLAAIQTGSIVALANKEALVCAGDMMLENVEKFGATLLPVDSEHNAIFQVLDLDQMDKVERLILTASGGPFLDLSYEEMRNVTKAQTLAHPNWDMGAKISVDSATMMNKGLELIEAVHLFPVGNDGVDIVIHPQSIIHSMVEYSDGSILAQMGAPDMRTPISYALGWPKRHKFKADRLDLGKMSALTFVEPDTSQFPALKLAKFALNTGKSAPTILNAANEVAVAGFLGGRIGFLDIVGIVEETLNRLEFVEFSDISDIYVEDRKGREVATNILRKICA